MLSKILFSKKNPPTRFFVIAAATIGLVVGLYFYSMHALAAGGTRQWYSVASSADGTKLAAVHWCGTIETSTDSGVTWVNQGNSGSRCWSSITSSADGMKLAAVDQSYDSIVTSTDGGVHWTDQIKSKGYNWYAIASDSTGDNLVAAENEGYIWTSTDGGVNWTKRTSAGFHYWYNLASSSDGSTLAAIDNSNGYVWVSTDGGVNWTDETSAGQHNWYGISMSSDGTKMVAVSPGEFIVTSTNSGADWSTNGDSSERHSWYAVTSSADGTKLAAVDHIGYIWTSPDAGVSWSTNTDSSGWADWFTIASDSTGAKLVAGIIGGEIWTSPDAGGTWSVGTDSSGDTTVTVTDPEGSPVGNVLVETHCSSDWVTFGTTNADGVVNGAIPVDANCSSGSQILFRISKTDYMTRVSSNNDRYQRYYFTDVDNNYPFTINPVDTSNTTNAYTADYWNVPVGAIWDPEFENRAPDVSKTIQTINADWANGSPSARIQADGFLARFNRTIHFTYAGAYTFTSGSDDGTRIYVDGALIMDGWNSGGGTVTHSVSAGNHTITVEYFEDGGAAGLYFFYSTASETVLQNVYESADTEVTPDVPGTEGDDTNITTTDGSYLTTAESNTTNGYDSQVFKFAPNLDGLTNPKFSATWVGHGAIPSNKNVTLSIWNFLSSAWESIAANHCADDCTLAGDKTGTNYKDEGGNTWIWAKADVNFGPPEISNVSANGGLLPIEWDTDMDATSMIAYDTVSHDNWNDYPNHLSDNTLVSSHTMTPALSNNTSQYWTGLATSADGTIAAGVSDCGYLQMSTDGGTTWANNDALGSGCWASIAMSADGSVIAVGTYGDYIYVSTDGGSTWSTNSGASGNGWWYSIAMSADGSHMVAGNDNNGYVYTSSDSGTTWTDNSGSSGNGYWRGVASDSTGDKLVAVERNNGYIYTSTDGGVTWSNNGGASGQAWWYSIASSADGTKLIAGDNNYGYVYLSTDSGANWSQIADIGKNYWQTASMSDDGSQIILGNNCNDLYTSTDSGATWTDHTTLSGCWSASAVSAGGEKSYMAKYFGSIWESTDAGANWTNKTGEKWYYRVRSANAGGSYTISDEYTLQFEGSSSCPFIFTFDGTKYNYIIDASSSATLGSGLDPDLWNQNPFYKDGAYPNPESYVKVPHGYLVPQTADAQDYYDIKTTFELNEVNYYDQAALQVIDHSPAVDVFPDYRNNGQIHTISKTAPAPVSVTTQDGRDVTSLVAANDNVYWHSSKLNNPSYLIIKLSDDVTTPAHLKIAIKKGKEGQFTGSKGSDKIQYKNSSGVFVDLPANKNPFSSTRAGASKSSRNLANTYGVDTKVIDLSGLSIKDNEIKFSMTNNQLQWDIDWLAVDTDADETVTTTTLAPNYADLHFRGVSKRVPTNPNDKNMQIDQPDYAQVIKTIGEGQPMHGNVTKYGDVLPLLTTVDNKFVIPVQGDELSLKYAVPAQADGTERDFIYKSWDYHKSWHAPMGDTVGPLPFNEMTRFPYKTSEEDYPSDADHNEYQATYNTRVIDWGTAQAPQVHHSLNTDSIALSVEEGAVAVTDTGDTGSVPIPVLVNFSNAMRNTPTPSPTPTPTPTPTQTPAPANGLSQGTCSASQILTQNLKPGSRNGTYNSFTKGTVKEVKILQAHLNRLGFASGKEDGILGPITKGAIMRMQKFLGVKADGLVGKNTRAAINNSCGK